VTGRYSSTERLFKIGEEALAQRKLTIRLIRTALLAGALLAGGLSTVLPAQADPLSPAEVAFLNDMHQARTGQSDPQLLQDDSGLLQYGWNACHQQANGVNPGRAGISPVITMYAFRNLCPQFH
jgi:hypothetical protein